MLLEQILPYNRFITVIGTIMSKMLTRENFTGAYLSYKVAEAMGHVGCVVNLQGKCVQFYIKNDVIQYREIDYSNRPEVVVHLFLKFSWNCTM